VPADLVGVGRFETRTLLICRPPHAAVVRTVD
jgi:hypothetical protein